MGTGRRTRGWAGACGRRLQSAAHKEVCAAAWNLAGRILALNTKVIRRAAYYGKYLCVHHYYGPKDSLADRHRTIMFVVIRQLYDGLMD